MSQTLSQRAEWTEEEYLALNGNSLVEFDSGIIEVLPMPTTSHQLMLMYLHGLLHAFVSRRRLGTALFAALRVRLWQGKFREPDIVFMFKKNSHRIGEEYWEGADLVMEIVSAGKEDRQRDLIRKRRDYARAGIPEYWIVDPHEERLSVLRLEGKRYVVHGTFSKGQKATSVLLPGFTVDVSEVFARRLAKSNHRRQRRRP